jgi:hypothetical protein
MRCDAVEKVPDYEPGKRMFEREFPPDLLVRSAEPLDLATTVDRIRRPRVQRLPLLLAHDEGKDKLREARYADGRGLEVLYQRRGDDAVAVRRIGGLTSSGCDVWVVGTDAEAAEWAQRLEREQSGQLMTRPPGQSGSFYAEFGYERPGDPAAGK